MTQLQDHLIEYGKAILRRRLLQPKDGWEPQATGGGALERARLILESPPSDQRLRPIIAVLQRVESAEYAPLAPLHRAVWDSRSLDPADLLKEFDEQCVRLPTGAGRFPSFVHLIGDYGARVSASRPELSVAYHWRLVAALSHCFERDSSEQVLLVGSDFAGLHEFMQVAVPKGAAKSLRGRSMYFQLLATVLARAVLREFRMPLCNLLTEGASKFLLILPGDAADEFEAFRREVTSRIIDLHGLEFSPQLAAIQTAAADLSDPGYRSTGQALHQRMTEASQSPLAGLAPDAVTKLFDPIGEGTQQVCKFCHVDLTKEYVDEHSEPEEGEGEPTVWCAQCRSFGRTGERTDRGLAQELARAHVLWVRDHTPDARLGAISWPQAELLAQASAAATSGWSPGASTNRPTWRECLAYFGFSCHLESEDDAAQYRDGECLVLNLRKPVLPPRCEPDVAYGFRWLGTATPWHGDPRHPVIVDTATMATAATGVHRYAVLAIDGDRMGDLYGECPSLQHALELGAAVSQYFEGWVDGLCRDQRKPEESAYLLYAGGDDLLIVGAWDKAAELAYNIRRNYASFAHHGVALGAESHDLASSATLSAGIALGSEYFPIYQTVRAAQRALERAKAFKLPNHPASSEPKDCFDFLGVTVPWTKVPLVRRFREELESIVGLPGDGGGHRAILQKLSSVWQDYELERQERGLEMGVWLAGRWLWRLQYFLTRACKDLGDARGAELFTLVDRDIMRTEAFAGGMLVPGIAWLPLAVRWADLLTRTTVETEDVHGRE